MISSEYFKGDYKAVVGYTSQTDDYMVQKYIGGRLVDQVFHLARDVAEDLAEDFVESNAGPNPTQFLNE